MESGHWCAILRRLPAEVHNQLTVTTVGGTEVVVQNFLQLEGECLVIKGRLSASQETGRVFFVPFDQIDYIGFTRTIAEDEYRSWFGESMIPATNGTPIEQPAASNGSTGKTSVPNRAALLERVRARTTAPGGSTNGAPSLPAPPPTST